MEVSIDPRSEAVAEATFLSRMTVITNPLMKKYWIVFTTTLKDFAAYRSQIYLNYIGWVTSLVIVIFLWKAIFENQEKIGHYTLPTMLSYFIFVRIAMSFVFSHIGFHYARDITRGDLSNYLHKPVSYPLFKLFYEIGANTSRTIIGALVYGIIIALFSDLFEFHLSLAVLPVAFVSLILGFLINYCLTAMMGMLSFWMTDSTRLIYIYFSFVTIFSGMAAPLDIFPQKIYAVLQWTPFPYTFFLPVKFLMNSVETEKIIENLAIQIFVLLLAAGAAFLMYTFGLKKYESVGK